MTVTVVQERVRVIRAPAGQPAVVRVLEQGARVIRVGIPGPPGPPGPSGDSVLRLSAATDLSGHRAVRGATDGARYASATDPGHSGRVVGIALGAASPGATVAIQRQGEISEPSWSWIPEQDIYLGSAGQLTQTIPQRGSAAFMQSLGYALSPTRIFVALSEPIAFEG